MKLFILIMMVTAFIGAFVSNTEYRGPHASDRSEHGGKRQYQSRRFLMPLAFASSMGGMATLIGTPRTSW